MIEKGESHYRAVGLYYNPESQSRTRRALNRLQIEGRTRRRSGRLLALLFPLEARMSSSNFIPIPPRSPSLASPGRSVLIVVDLQVRLMPKIQCKEEVVARVQQLIDAAHVLKVPILLSEQYPERLGKTIDELKNLPEPDSKRMFSCRELFPTWFSRLTTPCDTAIVCGIETHVCIQQTCLDLHSLGWKVVLPTDALSARHEHDHAIALRRMEQMGMTLTSTESMLFEWCECSTHPNFKAVSEIVKRLEGV